MDNFKARRLRILDAGLANYTGDFGLVNFENGVSTHEVNWIEAGSLAAIVHIEDADLPGYQLGGAAELERDRGRLADAPEVSASARVEEVDGKTRMVAEHFSRKELEQIADHKGLAGVRDIARAWKRTGRSIQECVDAILDAQGDAVQQVPEHGPAVKA